MNTKNIQIGIAVAAVIVFSAATALVVHHNDTVSNDHVMMSSQAMQAKAVKNAADTAAMKQAETDKMAAPHDAMTQGSTSASDSMHAGQ